MVKGKVSTLDHLYESYFWKFWKRITTSVFLIRISHEKNDLIWSDPDLIWSGPPDQIRSDHLMIRPSDQIILEKNAQIELNWPLFALNFRIISGSFCLIRIPDQIRSDHFNDPTLGSDQDQIIFEKSGSAKHCIWALRTSILQKCRQNSKITK
jgi:hypothetical protein